ncbi:MAG: DUF4058 family protein [Ardenticatenaceae bacterium]
MGSPYPGMDPYLEEPDLWAGFHHHLAEEILRQLNPLIVPKYFAEVEVHTVLQEVGIAMTHSVYPDAAILEIAPQRPGPSTAIAVPGAPIQRVVEIPGQSKLRAVRVYVTATKQLVTTIEVLSPVNKVGDGLRKYRRKRARILRSDVHLIELDLLHVGRRPGWELADPPVDTDYVVLLNRAGEGNRRLSEIWPVALNESLPVIPAPLLAPDPDVPLDLSVTFQAIYASAYYGMRIDYDQPVPPPPLRPAMMDWLSAQMGEN